MQIFAKYEAQEAITDREKVMEVRQVGGRQLQQIMRSGTVRASGVFAAARGVSGWYFKPAAIVLDLMIPKLDEFGVLQKLRSAGNKVPVTVLTAWGAVYALREG